MCLFEQRCEDLRVECIDGHLSYSGLQSCHRMPCTNIGTTGLVAYSRPVGRKRKTAVDGNILAFASSLRIGTEAPLTMNFVLAHCPDIVGMTSAPPRRRAMRYPSHAPSPSHSLFALCWHSDRYVICGQTKSKSKTKTASEVLTIGKTVQLGIKPDCLEW